MQFRKIAAVAGSALLAGATLATAGMAATVKNVGEITTKLGTAEEPFPVFVVGAGAAASDVAAAIDIAVRLAANSKRAEPVEVTTPEVSVTGGVLLESEIKKLHFKDKLNKTVKVLTANELGDLLAPGVVEDDEGNEYKYEQYIRIGGKTIEFGDPNPTDETKEAVYYIDLGTTDPSPDADYLVQAEIVFEEDLDIAQVKGKKITLFGQEFTIAPESADEENLGKKLILYKSADKVTVNAGETATLEVGGETYTVEVIGITDQDTAVVKINGITKEVKQGNTYNFGGLKVYIEDVFYYEVPTKTGSVVLSAGAEKYVFEDNYAVKIDDTPITGTKVSMKYENNKLSYLKIAFAALDNEKRLIKAGETWTDPLFGTIKVAFHGLDSAATEEIKIEPESKKAYRVVFTDRRGNKASLVWAYDNDLSDTTDAKLADSRGNEIKVVEGDDVKEGEYTFLAAEEGFERIVKTDIDIPNTLSDTEKDKATVTLKDVISGTEFEVTLEEDDVNSRVFKGKKVIDGQDYYIQLDASGTDPIVKITWGDGADFGVKGNEVTVYPIIRTSKGAIIALTKGETDSDGILSVDVASDNDTTAETLDGPTLVLPTGKAEITYTDDASGKVDSVTIAGEKFTSNGAKAIKVGEVYYVFEVSGIGGTSATVKLLGLEADQDGTYDGADDILTTPAIMLIEEEDADGQRNAVIIPIEETNKHLDLAKPILTGQNSDFQDIGEDENKAVDRYGVQIIRNEDEQDVIKIIYPDTQLVAKVAVGRDPKFEKTTTEVTRDVVIPITESIARLDTEIDETIKKTRDLIVVGGPCINRIAAELLGKPFPACGEESGIPEGGAIIRVFPDKYAEGKTAVLVAGWDKEATRQAASLLQSGALEEYDAEAVKIVDSSIEEIRVEETPTEETATE